MLRFSTKKSNKKKLQLGSNVCTRFLFVSLLPVCMVSVIILISFNGVFFVRLLGKNKSIKVRKNGLYNAIEKPKNCPFVCGYDIKGFHKNRKIQICHIIMEIVKCLMQTVFTSLRLAEIVSLLENNISVHVHFNDMQNRNERAIFT